MNSKLNLKYHALMFQMYANMLNVTEDSRNIKYRKVEYYLYNFLSEI